jgi:hypothetical protein
VAAWGTGCKVGLGQLGGGKGMLSYQRIYLPGRMEAVRAVETTSGFHSSVPIHIYPTVLPGSTVSPQYLCSTFSDSTNDG